jgi:hypothetical protein
MPNIGDLVCWKYNENEHSGWQNQNINDVLMKVGLVQKISTNRRGDVVVQVYYPEMRAARLFLIDWFSYPRYKWSV